MANDGKLVVLMSPGVQATPGPQVYVSSVVDPVGPPTPADGDLYYNSVLREWMFYDGGRAKWLAQSRSTIQAGRNGNTGAGTFYRAINGMVLSAALRSIPCDRGTLVTLALSRTGLGVATLDVLNNGVVVASLTHSAPGVTQTSAINVDISSGSLSFQNNAGGAATNNVQIVLGYRRRT